METDSSDLFSLGELMTLEHDRIRDETAAEAAEREAEERAQREAEERIWREAEQTRRNDEARHRRESEARERARRDTLLRLIQAEARMEDEAERLVEAARLEAEARSEAEIRAQRPVGTVVGLTVAALLSVVGPGAWLMHSDEARLARTRAVVERAIERERAAVLAHAQAERTQFEAERARLGERIAAASARAERQRQRQRMAEVAAEQARRAQPMQEETVKKVAVAASPAAPEEPQASLTGDLNNQ